MTEAKWGDGTMSPDVDWRTSAALKNVPRADPAHRADAILTPERPLVVRW